MNEQVINYGNQKLLLLDGTAHKLDSKTAIEWAENWFTANWNSVKLIGDNRVHLCSLVQVSRAAADFIHNSDRRTELNLIACVGIGKQNHDLGIAA